MLDSSRRQPASNGFAAKGFAGTGAAPEPMHRQEGGPSAGWVIAEITPYPRPLRPLSHTNAGISPNGSLPARQLSAEMSQESLEDFFAAQYAPPEAQFVLAVIEHPGRQMRRGRLRWGNVEIVLRSPQAWPVQLAAEGMGSAAPRETPELRGLVEELAAEALRQGWESAGSGRTWCSLRFRQRSAR